MSLTHQITLLSLLFVACNTVEVTDPPGDKSPGISDSASSDTAFDGACARPISEAELSVLADQFPDAECGARVAIRAAHLVEDDADLGNLDLMVLYDAEGVALGAARRVFTPVYCAAGVCEAIVFMMVYETDGSFRTLFHPPEERFDLKKYWEDEYLTFSEEDMALLNAQLADPPAILLAAENTDALVEGTHGTAPTLPEYQPYVVRGAAFTCYVILEYSVRTQAALVALDLTGAR